MFYVGALSESKEAALVVWGRFCPVVSFWLCADIPLHLYHWCLMPYITSVAFLTHYNTFYATGLWWQSIFDPWWGLREILTWQWLLSGLDPKSLPIHGWRLNPLNHRTPLLQVSGAAHLRSYNKHASTKIPLCPQAQQLFSGVYHFSVFHSMLCVVVSYFVEKQNCSMQSVRSGIIAGQRAGRSALQWQPWNHDWRQQTSVTVCVCSCVTAGIVDWVLSWHLCDFRNDEQLHKEALFHYFVAGLDNSEFDGLRK